MQSLALNLLEGTYVMLFKAPVILDFVEIIHIMLF